MLNIRFLCNFLSLFRKIVRESTHINREKITAGAIDISMAELSVSPLLFRLYRTAYTMLKNSINTVG
jgi:hypothetical protein